MVRRIVTLTVLVSLLLLMICLPGSLSPVSGKTTSAYFAYLPLINKPPEPPAWIGPDGGQIIAIAIAASQPSTVYAGTWGSGVYKSTDSGKTWTWKSYGLAHSYINAIAVDPNDPKIVYAGTYTGKLYKTIDGGES